MDWKYLLTSYEGRINRAKFWAGTLVLVGVALVTMFVDMMIGTYSMESGIGLISGIWAIASLYLWFSIYTKRWHDRDKSGWWSLIILIPLIGAIWILIELGILRGTPGPNRFGADPLQ